MECRLFDSISDSEQEEMLKCAGAKHMTFNEGDFIFRQGDEPLYMYLIISGSVMISKDFASGKRSLLFTVYEKDVFGEMFLFSDEKEYWYDAIACERVEVIRIPWKFFFCFCNNACSKHQNLVKNMLGVQSDKNFLMTKKLYLLSGKSLKERVAIWALDMAKGKPSFKCDMNREELADYLGTTRPSLSRELMNMQAEGLLEVHKADFKILDREGLEDFSY